MTQVAATAPSTTVVAPLNAMEALASAALALGQLDAGSARERASALEAKRDVALKQAAESLQAAQKAREDGGFFSKWGSTLQGVAIVASAAATVATCGAGGPVFVLALAAATCSVASYAMKETGADGKLCKLNIGGKEIQLNWSDAVALAGVACGGASAVVSATQTGAQASAAAGRAGASATESSARGAANAAAVGWQRAASDGIRTAGLGVAAGATAGRGYCTVRAGQAEADAVDDEADAKRANSDFGVAKSQTEDLIDELQGVRRTQSKIIEIVSNLVETQNQTVSAMLSRRA